MLKMILDPVGGIVMTNDGNAILREIDVAHPAAKSMIELSRTQDEEVGDGTTSVIILGKQFIFIFLSLKKEASFTNVLAGEALSVAEPWIVKNMHPTVVISAYLKALDDAVAHMDKIAVKIDKNPKEDILKIVKSSVGTKFISRWGDKMCELAIDAVNLITVDHGKKKEIDIKRYLRVERVNIQNFPTNLQYNNNILFRYQEVM